MHLPQDRRVLQLAINWKTKIMRSPYTAVHRTHYLTWINKFLFINTQLGEHCLGPEKAQARNWGTRPTAQFLCPLSMKRSERRKISASYLFREMNPVPLFTSPGEWGGGVARPSPPVPICQSLSVCQLQGLCRHKTEKHSIMLQAGIELRAREPNASICGATGIGYTYSFNNGQSRNCSHTSLQCTQFPLIAAVKIILLQGSHVNIVSPR